MLAEREMMLSSWLDRKAKAKRVTLKERKKKKSKIFISHLFFKAFFCLPHLLAAMASVAPTPTKARPAVPPSVASKSLEELQVLFVDVS